MTIRTSPTLPTDHAREGRTNHHERAALMRHTDDWVHIGNYATRKAAHNMSHQIRCGIYPAYASHRYEAETVTTADGVHQVWGHYAGERRHG